MFKTKFITLLVLLPLLTSGPTPGIAVNITPEPVIEVKELDQRARILQAYLARYNSPLQYHAADFVEAADTYRLDWKLVAAISGVESTFGKRTPGGCNSWGWGVYGDQALKFNSCRHGIFTVSEGLRKNYIDKGLLEPLAMNRKYAASPTWGVRVNYFLNDMSKFEAKYRGEQPKLVSGELQLPKLAMEYLKDDQKEVNAQLSSLPEELNH